MYYEAGVNLISAICTPEGKSIKEELNPLTLVYTLYLQYWHFHFTNDDKRRLFLGDVSTYLIAPRCLATQVLIADICLVASKLINFIT